MDKPNDIVGFGARATGEPHCWIIRIPRERSAPVTLLEDFGRNGWGSGTYDPVVRAVVPRAVWDAVAEPLRSYINTRLKEAGFRSSRFVRGDNRMERLLGTEACLLAWMIDDASEHEAREAFDQFTRYMSCELRCLYQYASGSDGWRRGLKFAFIPSRSVKEAA